MSESAKIPHYVLDSFALIAFLEDEPGAARVKAVLSQAEKQEAQASLTIINYGEVIYLTEREKGLTAAQSVIAILDQLPITIVEADRKLTFAAAHVKAQNALSYADAFVVALANSLAATILTGDAEFKSVEQKVAIEWLPSK